jgi:antitoxin VapB
MARTRAFKVGGDQAIRIPAEMAYADIDIDLEISRLGDVITIIPARNTMSDVVAELRRMPKPSRVEEREPIEVGTRRGKTWNSSKRTARRNPLERAVK